MANGDERKGEGGRSEENDDKGHCEWYGRRGGLIAKCARLRGYLNYYACEGQALRDMSIGKACAAKPEAAPFWTAP